MVLLHGERKVKSYGLYWYTKPVQRIAITVNDYNYLIAGYPCIHHHELLVYSHL